MIFRLPSFPPTVFDGARCGLATAISRYVGFVGAVLVLSLGTNRLSAQPPGQQYGEVVPRDVREMYDRGLRYLADSQHADGHWEGSNQGPGVTGMALLAMLASGEDPNFGLYSGNLRRGLRSIIRDQNATSGIIGESMYQHGFATLALAEAYGAVDDRSLWVGQSEDVATRSLAAALELAIRGSLTAQDGNQFGAWRYMPESRDADTSVSGAVLVSLLAARNAGIEVPDAAIDRGISYFQSMTSEGGQVAYAGGLGGFDESLARISIATLVYSVARRKDLPEFTATLEYLTQRLEQEADSYLAYTLYYQAQALFQGDVDAWQRWNQQLVRTLKQNQQEDGQFRGQFGPTVESSLSLLALALNYRFLPIYER